jgi:hypothetical protein
MKKLSNLMTAGFEGTDVSLDIALYEYGLIWRKTAPGEYLFYYGVECDDEGNYTKFDWAHMSKADWTDLLNEDWVDIEEVEKYADNTKQELIDTFPHSVYTLVSYHGYENIFGSAYYPFTVKDNIGE